MDTFDKCHLISRHIESNKLNKARNELIKLLDYYKSCKIPYTPLINHLIRQVGLYPYLQLDTASWQDRFIHESFKVDTGDTSPKTLHKEQSVLLKRLLEGESLAVSAPTSFGKSFIIDSFISIKEPQNVVIIVPTIALTDETRRRINRKFSNSYKIITTTEVELAPKNIFIFPQERAASYLDKIKKLDLLVIDEFYKASPAFDKERSPSLLKAILQLGEIADQKYFLAPNISNLNKSIFTKGMEFIKIDFNTVYLEMNYLYRDIMGDKNKKNNALVKILAETDGKTLIYAGTYAAIDEVSDLIINNTATERNRLLRSFSIWLSKNYCTEWNLIDVVKKGSGIHNGRLHRSLSQIQIKLFEEEKGLNQLISTSSIIEGVNTSAENVIVWKNKNGSSNLNDFTYKNIIGRGGRMFKHFIGKIYILDTNPPKPQETQLDLEFPDELNNIDQEEYKQDLTKEQIAKIIEYKDDMSKIFGKAEYEELINESNIESSNAVLIKKIAIDISLNRSEWKGIGFLNSDDSSKWDHFLYKIIKIQPGGWGIEYSKFVKFIKILENNWLLSIPQLLKQLEPIGIDIDLFFQLEKKLTFNFSSILKDVNTILSKLLKDNNTDISPFIYKTSHAFLPSMVYQLEEYGLPRMISQKIHDCNLINFEDITLNLHNILDRFLELGSEQLKDSVPNLDSFDKYIINNFYDGIIKNEKKNIINITKTWN